MPLFSLFPIEPPQVSSAAASRAVVQGSDKGMYMYEECRILFSNPHVASIIKKILWPDFSGCYAAILLIIVGVELIRTFYRHWVMM